MGCSNAKQVKSTTEDDGENWKALHSAIRWNKEDSWAHLISPESSNLQDPGNGNYPIHIAAQNGHEVIVRLLITNKADINAQNNGGQTALHMCVEYDYYWVAKTLVDAGADQDIVNNDGFKAGTGISGKKTGVDVTFAFTCARNTDELNTSMDMLLKDAEDPAKKESIDKAAIAGAGMKFKKGEHWNSDLDAKFKTLMRSI